MEEVSRRCDEVARRLRGLFFEADYPCFVVELDDAVVAELGAVSQTMDGKAARAPLRLPEPG